MSPRAGSTQAPDVTSDRGVYGISTAAELVGMGVQNLRLVNESRGLLEPDRTDGGTRRYNANDLDRLRRISELLDAGLNLAGIGMVLDLEAQVVRLRTRARRSGSGEIRIPERWRFPKRTSLTSRACSTPTSRRTTAVSSVRPSAHVDEADRLDQQRWCPSRARTTTPASRGWSWLRRGWTPGGVVVCSSWLRKLALAERGGSSSGAWAARVPGLRGRPWRVPRSRRC